MENQVRIVTTKRGYEHIDLPMPVIDCKFKDEETIKQLSKFQRNKKMEVI